MANKKPVSFRSPKELTQQVEEFREERNMSESDAYRQLVQRGLDYSDLKAENEKMRERLDEMQKRVEEIEETNKRIKRLERKIEEQEEGILSRLF